MFRRYWLPVGASEELTDLPKPVRVLSEDLVLFRDGQGRPGLLGNHCAHRGTSLVYGQIEEAGIRCCYHGWLYDTEGQVLDTPCEPADSTFKNGVRQLAYPCRELGGLIFAYMGPRDKMPELPRYDFLVREDGTRRVFSRTRDCNWLQGTETVGDPTHTAILHGRQFPARYSRIPTFETQPTELGMLITTRRPDDKPNWVWQRVEELLLPSLQMIAETSDDSEGEPAYYGAWRVPIDDTHNIAWQVNFLPLDPSGQPRRASGHDRGGPGRNPGGRTFEEIQRDPGDPEAQMSAGLIAQRQDWHLATSDKGVIMWEQTMLEAIDAVERGDDPKGIIRDPVKAAFIDVRPRDEVVPDPRVVTPA
jgi:nitrite reductase/ring-hydroxylating ferredoxin subunit